jgi:hypothetical protein
MVFSLFRWFFSLFGGSGDSVGRAKKRALKRTAKALASNKYGKFFRAKSVEALPDMAWFFYGVYKAVSPAQRFLQSTVRSAQLKQCAVLSFLDSAQLNILERLSVESIEKRAKETEAEQLERELRREFEVFARSFNAGLIHDIDECYNLILIIREVVVYDYFFLLKKFDPQFTEHNFTGTSVFNFLRGEAVVEELKDFLELTGGLDPDRDWNTPLRVLEKFKGTELIDPKLWYDLLVRIRELVRSEIFELIIRFTEKDPFWTREPRVQRENIAEAYLEQIRDETFDNLALLITAKQNALIERRARAVFGNARVTRLKHYTEQGSEIYKSKNFPGFIHARALNYLIVFLTDIKQELRSLHELILIRGQWVSPALSFPLSESLRLLGLFPARITELDGMCSERGFYGGKLKPAIVNYDREKSLGRSIAVNLDSANGEARQILNDAIFNLSVLEGSLGDLLEDCRKISGVILLNWAELNAFSETNLEDRIAAMRNKAINMLELLRVLFQEFVAPRA